jgi:outer membrane lipoprotein-sorting protein
MASDESGRAISGSVGVLAIAMIVVVGTVIGGMVVATDAAPTGNEVLEDAHDRYDSAETIAGTANVTVEAENGTVERSADVEFVLTDDNESRVAVTASNRTVVTGSNGSAGWAHLEETGLTWVVNFPEDPGNWSEINASSMALRGGIGVSAAETGVLGERYEDLIPADGANVSEDAYPWNLTRGDYDLNLSESDYDRNLSESGYAKNTSEHWNGSQAWNRSELKNMAFAWTPENVSAKRLGTETIDGTEAHLIAVEPPGDRNATLRLWIGTEDATVLKSQFEAAGLTVTTRYTNVQFNTSIADSTFQPPGAGPVENGMVDSRDELQATTAFDVPVLPDTYTFTTGSVVTYGGVTAAVGSYAGPGNVTVVATTAESLPIDGVSTAAEANATTVELSGVTASVADTDRGVVVSWKADGVRNAVISEDSREAAVSAAESIIGGDGTGK